jgi:hypothetical protein
VAEYAELGETESGYTEDAAASPASSPPPSHSRTICTWVNYSELPRPLLLDRALIKGMAGGPEELLRRLETNLKQLHTNLVDMKPEPVRTAA